MMECGLISFAAIEGDRIAVIDLQSKLWLRVALRAALVGSVSLCALLVWERHVVTKRWSIRRTYERGQIAEFSSSSLNANVLGLAPSDPALARVSWLRRWLGDEAINSIAVRKPSVEVEQALLWFPESQISRIALDPFLSPQRLPTSTTQLPAPSPKADASDFPPLPSPALKTERFID